MLQGFFFLSVFFPLGEAKWIDGLLSQHLLCAAAKLPRTLRYAGEVPMCLPAGLVNKKYKASANQECPSAFSSSQFIFPLTTWRLGLLLGLVNTPERCHHPLLTPTPNPPSPESLHPWQSLVPQRLKWIIATAAQKNIIWRAPRCSPAGGWEADLWSLLKIDWAFNQKMQPSASRPATAGKAGGKHAINGDKLITTAGEWESCAARVTIETKKGEKRSAVLRLVNPTQVNDTRVNM